MKRVVPTFVALMALTMGTAWANDEEKRRVLKLDDVGVETQSEFYRQKAREKRHESIKFLTDLLRNNPPGASKRPRCSCASPTCTSRKAGTST